jgi:hypothetical protein
MRSARKKEMTGWSVWLAVPEKPIKKKVGIMKRIACNGIGLVLSVGLLGLSALAQNQSQSGESSLGDYARQVRKAPAPKQRVFDNDNLPKDTKLSIIGPAPAAEGATTENPGEAKTAESTNATPAAGENKAAPSGDSKAPADAKSAADTKSAADSKSTAEEKAPLKSEAKPADDKAPLKSTAKTPAEEEAEKEAARQAAIKQWEDKLTAQKEQIDLLARELNVLQREYQIRAAAMYADAGNRIRNQADWDKQDAEYKQQIADKQKALDDAKQKLDDMHEDARTAGVPASAREQ